VAARVVERQRQRHERAIGRVLRQAAERVRVGEEERDVVQAVEIDVGDDDVRVIEVEGVVEGVRVRCDDQDDGGGAGKEKVAIHFRALSGRSRVRMEG